MVHIQRYLLFTWDDYEAYGGWEDYTDADDDLEAVLEWAAESHRDRYQVVDLMLFQVVYAGEPKSLLAKHEEK